MYEQVLDKVLNRVPIETQIFHRLEENRREFLRIYAPLQKKKQKHRISIHQKTKSTQTDNMMEIEVPILNVDDESLRKLLNIQIKNQELIVSKYQTDLQEIQKQDKQQLIENLKKEIEERNKQKFSSEAIQIEKIKQHMKVIKKSIKVQEKANQDLTRQIDLHQKTLECLQ
ncbi:hypothetical protein pb186bvf_015725 [Paramecium bursaria]